MGKKPQNADTYNCALNSQSHLKHCGCMLNTVTSNYVRQKKVTSTSLCGEAILSFTVFGFFQLMHMLHQTYLDGCPNCILLFVLEFD